MLNKYMPGLQTAGGNGRFIHAPEIPDFVETLDGSTVALPPGQLRLLSSMRRNAGLIDEIDVSYLQQLPPAADWNELDNQAYSIYERHLAANDAVTAREAYDIKYAAKAATGLIMAFLEVVPRVVVHDEFTDPNPDIAELAHGSIGLILGWLSLSQATDAGLTYALMRPKPRRQTVGLEDFYNMRYSPKWFTRQAGSIVLRPEKVPDMRNDANRHPAIADHPKDVIFGCPARSHVPRLYRAMVAKAMHDDLFGPTYLRERMNTGYGPA